MARGHTGNEEECSYMDFEEEQEVIDLDVDLRKPAAKKKNKKNTNEKKKINSGRKKKIQCTRGRSNVGSS